MNKKRIISASLIVISFLIPILIKDFYILHVFIMTYIAITAAVGLGLLMSGGMISCTQAGIMAIGAYSSSLLVMKAGLSFWLALPLSGLISTTLGLVVCYPTLRLKGLYFIMVTFAVSEMIRLVIVNWPSFLGGYSGIPMVPKPNPIAIPGLTTIEFTSKIPYYYLILVIMLIALLTIYRLYVSRMGRVLRSLHESDVLAESIGINVMRYKAIAFGIVCFFAGLAGSFLAHYNRLVAPEFFTIWVSIYYLIYAQVGGHATVLGPLLGASFFSILPEFLRGMRQYSPIIFSVLLVLAIFFLPGGLETLPRRLKTYWHTRILGRAPHERAKEDRMHGLS